MNIPEEAIDAVEIALEAHENWYVHDYCECECGEQLTQLPEELGYPPFRKHRATAALEAALPHLEAALRTQIAADLQERLVPADQTEVAVWIRNQAARIAEEGAFHCCAHPKCPGGSICCCPDAEEGNTK